MPGKVCPVQQLDLMDIVNGGGEIQGVKINFWAPREGEIGPE